MRSATTVGVTVAERRAARKAAISCGDDLADRGDVGGALALVDLLGQPGEPVERDAGQLGDGGVDVVRQGQVDHGERPLGTGARGGDHLQRQHHPGGAGAGHQQVDVGDHLADLR